MFRGLSELSVSVLEENYKANTFRELFSCFGLLKSVNKGERCGTCMVV